MIFQGSLRYNLRCRQIHFEVPSTSQISLRGNAKLLLSTIQNDDAQFWYYWRGISMIGCTSVAETIVSRELNPV